MAVHPAYLSPARAEELRRGVLAQGLAPHAIETLVGVPSNADSLAAATLAVRPRRVLVLRTRDLGVRHVQDLRGWLDVWPFDWPKPSLEGLDGEELSDEEILPTLSRLVPEARKAAILVTGGTKPHTALLTRHAQASGSHVLHVDADYDDARRPIPGTGTVKILPVPADVIRREALLRAHVLLRDRGFDAAREVLEEVRRRSVADRGNLVALTLVWIEACRARDAMLFVEARRLASELVTMIDGVGRPDNQALTHKALRLGAEKLRQICADLDLAIAEGGRWETDPRLPLVVELLLRAQQERAAGRRNHAALLFYRVVETCLSERLRVAWRVNPARSVGDAANRMPPSAPATGKVPGSADELTRAFTEAARAVGAPDLDLCRPLGLVAQQVYLLALEDPALPTGSEDIAKELRQWSNQRNRSIFAHGFGAVDPAELETIERLLGVGDPRAGLLSLVAPDGPSRGELNKLLRLQQGPVLDEGGESLS